MRPTVNSLAARRPAFGALTGALPREGHFGHEAASFGYDDALDAEFGWEGQEVAADAGDPSFAVAQLDRGDDREIGVNRDAFRSLARNDVSTHHHLTEAQRKLQQYNRLEQMRDERTAQHAMKLDPNHNQRLKLGIYSFGLSQALTIGIAVGLYMSDSPATTLRTKRLVMNAPTVGFATVTGILIANVSVTVGGVEDAFAYGAQSFANEVDYPTLPPSQKATMNGSYAGFAPAPLYNGQAFVFSVRFSGVSTIAGGA